MKALTLWRPWPWAIFHAPEHQKRVENRPWKPWESIVNTRIVLHAGKKFDSESAEDLCSMFGFHPDGDVPHGWKDEGLVGVATVRGCASTAAECDRFMVGQSAWFSGPFAWLLGDVVTFAEPIPAKGMQGLWDLAPEQERLVREALR